VNEKKGKGVGVSLRRKEDRRHLHGLGQFVGDVRMPGMLDAAFVRSSVAHGVVKAVDIPADCAGRVFTAKDFPALKPIVAMPKIEGFKYSEHPVLASERVRFAGEAVAVAVAPTRGEAEDVVEKISLEIEELPAVVDMLAAVKPGAPLIRQDWGDNVFVQRTNTYGDLEAAKKNAAVTITREYRMNRQSPVPPGTTGWTS
jgi:carbon-monoxide dehydrogenase large subunit